MGLYKSSCLLLLVLVALTITKANPASSGNGGPQGVMLARCNYTEVGARSCASCDDVMLCTPLDVGIVRRCRGNRSHCNQGACSDTPSANCNSTSSQRRRPTFGIYVKF